MLGETEEELFCGMSKMLSFPFLCDSGHYSVGAAKPIKRHDSVEIQLIMYGVMGKHFLSE